MSGPVTAETRFVQVHTFAGADDAQRRISAEVYCRAQSGDVRIDDGQYFRKGQSVVEARQFKPDTYSFPELSGLARWCGGSYFSVGGTECIIFGKTGSADRGDWIVRGVDGEFRAAKPQDFEAGFVPVSAADSPGAARVGQQ